MDLIKVNLFNNNQRISLQFQFEIGKGIYLVRDIEQFKEKYSEQDSNGRKRQVSVKPNRRIIQRFLIFFLSLSVIFSLECFVFSYIANPLLINGKKFDIRCYMLISSVKPLIVLYHSGYIRLSMFDFDAQDQNLLIHLTNQVFLFFLFSFVSSLNLVYAKERSQIL